MRIMVWWGLSVVSQYWIWKVLQLGGVEVGQWEVSAVGGVWGGRLLGCLLRYGMYFHWYG